MTMIVVIGNQQLVFYVSLVSQNAAQLNPLWDIPLTSNVFNSPNPLIETNSICPEIGEVWREVEVDQQCNV